jgi:prepilin-type N-terminal cleavage/methylation domain-containing protein
VSPRLHFKSNTFLRRCNRMSLARHEGYTLVELIVVLILLTIAAAVVAPSFRSPGPKDSSAFPTVIGSAREAAIRRGEMVRLHIDRFGAWQASAGTDGQTEFLMAGSLSDLQPSSTDFLFSAFGTCALAIESSPSEALATLDPLTCEMRSR